jgi:hypothetical protein
MTHAASVAVTIAPHITVVDRVDRRDALIGSRTRFKFQFRVS